MLGAGKINWRRVTRTVFAASLVLLLLLVAGDIFILLARSKSWPSDRSRLVTRSAAPRSDWSGPVSRISGLPTNGEETRPLAVVVENHVDSRPLSGIARAPLVFEAPVEGGITRLLLVFDGESDAAEIGPVRSARSYFIDWAREFDALFAHVGGSPAALEELRRGAARDLNQFFNGQYFWRATARRPPHNVYTSAELLARARAARRDDEPAEFAAWNFYPADSRRQAGQSFEIEIFFSTREYEVAWVWDQQRSLFVRLVGGGPDRDADGSAVTAANVAVIRVRTKVLDQEGRLMIETIGEGEAVVFQDGRALAGRWRKDSAADRLRFYDSTGQEVAWRPGKTWIEAVPEKVVIKYGGEPGVVSSLNH